ncbi:PQQ-binding-like beta-propeller repeat protein [Conexibacter stalactiti]|uniref:PQQ-binding-like beta-propeller repeat protein n=1 Tax=Conexibacter stalactiti TaxID=1940611 RepID=A0ABU4HIM4_9ACTN|nr:PQQ-binding-like beta-propeller repeat protein [Conexibacter stalactiti]MDW5593100.1 PQQ-binding-like beta-propeller repeat protein [Conexibacter stalactiti]MEC5033741.1 PQQ-binding-like beta-propeller repeat protein [Conexibacter stalactiti]
MTGTSSDNPNRGTGRRLLGACLLALVTAVLAVTVAACGGGDDDTTTQSRTIPGPVPAAGEIDPSSPSGRNWPVTGGDYAHTQFSPLKQIDADNVKDLKGDFMLDLDSGTEAKYSHEENILAINGDLYISTGANDVFAIDSRAKRIKWRVNGDLDPEITSVCCGWESRGLGYNGTDTLYSARIDGRVQALDLETGRVKWDVKVFDWKRDNATAIAAPLYYNGLVYIGNSGSELLARGRVTALDAKTGELKWQFWTTGDGNDPVADPTWEGDSARTGGSGLWNAPAVDRERNLLIFGTSTAGPDVNGSRRGGDNLYSNSIVAIDATSGRYKWHFQLVRHDIWDFTVSSPVVLFDAEIDGEKVPAAAIAPKMPWVYAVDRRDGRPIYPGRETPVPQAPENKTAATQWIPSTPPLMPAKITDEQFRALVGQIRTTPAIPNAGTIRINRPEDGNIPELVFNPSGTERGAAVHISAPQGGTTWAPMSYSPETHMLYVCGQTSIGWSAQGSTPTAFTEGQFVIGGGLGGLGFDTPGYLTALDADTNEPVWSYRMKDENGRPQSCYSGSAATAGNLVFVGKNDGRLVALNATTGEQLWDFQTGAGANAPATVFEVDGKQKVAIVAGGNALAGSPHGANLWVFSLDGDVMELDGTGEGEAITHGGGEPTDESAEGDAETREDVSARPDADAGRTVFADNCATCHGVTGRGGNGGPDLTAIPSARDLDAVIRQTTDGGSAMPAFGDSLSPKEIQDVAAFVTNGIN